MEYHVAYATDSNYSIPTCISIYSVIMNASSSDNYHFHLVLSEKNTVILEFVKTIRRVFSNINFHTYIIGPEITGGIIGKNEHITKMAYARLFLPFILTECDRCVYLDSDVIVCRNLNSFISMNIGNKLIAGCAGTYALWRDYIQHASDLGLNSAHDYVNSGVILMDLAAMRTSINKQHIIDLMTNFYQGNDQDLLNIICRGKIFHFPFFYNYMPLRLLEVGSDIWKIMSQTEVYESVNNPYIVHLLTYNKPWRNLSYDIDGSWIKCYSSFLKMLELHSFPKNEFTNAINSFNAKFFKTKLKYTYTNKVLNSHYKHVFGIGKYPESGLIWKELLKGTNIEPTVTFDSFEAMREELIHNNQELLAEDLIIEFSPHCKTPDVICDKISFDEVYIDLLKNKQYSFVLSLMDNEVDKSFFEDELCATQNSNCFLSVLMSKAFHEGHNNEDVKCCRTE